MNTRVLYDGGDGRLRISHGRCGSREIVVVIGGGM